jgi:hypothetical protein
MWILQFLPDWIFYVQLLAGIAGVMLANIPLRYVILSSTNQGMLKSIVSPSILILVTSLIMVQMLVLEQYRPNINWT